MDKIITKDHDDAIFREILGKTRDIVMATRPGPACPNIDQLLDFASGLYTDDFNEIEYHLQDCLACRLVVTRVKASQDFWIRMLDNSPEQAVRLAMRMN